MFTKADIEKYFTAEKQESLVFIIIGVVAIILGLLFYFYWKTSWMKGAAIPLLVIGIIQGVVGYAVYRRTDEQRINIVYSYDMDPARLKSEELPRMDKVNRNFVVYRWVEIILLIGGIIIIILNYNKPERSFLFGLGITLAIQSAIMLGADYFAEKRALEYAKGLQGFVSKS